MIVFWWLGCSEPVQNKQGLPQFSNVSLSINQISFSVPYAQEPHEVALGLRYRDISMEEGMLLAVDGGEISMTGMKQPLSAALLGADGSIQDIWMLELNSSHRTIPKETAFLLEMHESWFMRYQVKPDMKVVGLPEQKR